MIIFGTRHKPKGQIATAVNCPECSQGQLWATSIVSYFHIYWIPFIPYRKQKLLVCDQCQTALEEKDLRAHGIAKQISYPSFSVFHFTGAILAAILLTVGMWSASQNRERMAKMISNPSVGDLYVIKFDEPVKDDNGKSLRYGVVRVSAVSSTDTTLLPSAYAFSSVRFAKEKIESGLLDTSKEFVLEESFEEPKDRLIERVKEVIRGRTLRS